MVSSSLFCKWENRGPSRSGDLSRWTRPQAIMHIVRECTGAGESHQKAKERLLWSPTRAWADHRDPLGPEGPNRSRPSHPLLMEHPEALGTILGPGLEQATESLSLQSWHCRAGEQCSSDKTHWKENKASRELKTHLHKIITHIRRSWRESTTPRGSDLPF